MTQVSVSATRSRSGGTFDALVTALQAQFDDALQVGDRMLFRTAPTVDLNAVYLANLPAEDRQHHTCHACQQFLRRYGSLVVIRDDGVLYSAIWGGDVPEPYRAAVTALARAVECAAVSGVALFSEPIWGTPETGDWTHFALRPPMDVRFHGGAQTANQAMAAKREDYRTLRQGLAEFDRAVVAQAVTLLAGESLYRPEKVVGPARFLLDLHDACARVRGRQRDNLVWRAVASAPAGWCQPRSTMIGTLLEDIAAGLDFAAVKRRFDAKLQPLQYQRPQAAPAAGTIQQAEKLVEQLGIASALRRRFARLDEIEAIWRPAAASPIEPAAGVFGHLQPKGAVGSRAPLTMPAQVITWTKFARTVLPEARAIQVSCTSRMNLCGLLTAADPEAKPILQWDSETQRNPFSWYVYQQGSQPEQWALTTGNWARVTAVALQPSMWYGEERAPHQGKSAIFILDGARDSRDEGLALFPETLQASLHGVRSVIEAYSRTGHLEGREEASANGLCVGEGSPNHIRVTSDTGVAAYTIDRWE